MANQTAFKKYRKLRGLTQSDLARKSGLSKRTIENAENGQRISRGSLLKLAEALDVAPADLVGGPGARSPQEMSDKRQRDPVEELLFESLMLKAKPSSLTGSNLEVAKLVSLMIPITNLHRQLFRMQRIASALIHEISHVGKFDNSLRSILTDVLQSIHLPIPENFYLLKKCIPFAEELEQVYDGWSSIWRSLRRAIRKTDLDEGELVLEITEKLEDWIEMTLRLESKFSEFMYSNFSKMADLERQE